MLLGDVYIVIGLIISGISLYLRTYGPKKISQLKKYFVILLFVIGALLTNHGYSVRTKELTTPTGQLHPPKIDVTQPFEIQFGGLYYTVSIQELEMGINMSNAISFENFIYPFEIKLKENRLFVSAEILDESLETIAIIKDNEWTVNENAIIARDRNYNDYAFEVVDAQFRPRLQVILMQKNKIFIGGYFYSVEGEVLATPDILIFNPSPEDFEEYIQNIFKYPSNSHLHELGG